LAVHFAKLNPTRVTQRILEDPVGLEDYWEPIPAQATQRLFQDELQMSPQAYRELIKRYLVTRRPEYESCAIWRERIALRGKLQPPGVRRVSGDSGAHPAHHRCEGSHRGDAQVREPGGVSHVPHLQVKERFIQTVLDLLRLNQR